MGHERLVATLIELADTLVDGFDATEFLHVLAQRCVELLAVDAAGVLLAAGGKLRPAASSDERVRGLDQLQLRHERGPSVSAFQDRAPAYRPDLSAPDPAEPEFARAAVAAGYRAVHALPLRRRSDTIGALGLFRAAAGPLDEQSRGAAEAMTRMATIGLLQANALDGQQRLTQQLQHALTSRIVIEQAKGVIAERLAVEMPQAFETLRRYSRAHNRRLSEVARSVVSDGLTIPPLDGL